MNTKPLSTAAHVSLRQSLNKVPEATVYFWFIKIMCTTVGETAADFLNVNLNLGLEATAVLMAALLAVALVIQFRTRKYVPAVYWLAVVLISVVGTLITDLLTDNVGISLKASTLVFMLALAATFAVWFAVEKTLNIHAINTTRREIFYWLAILFTFALGTAAGDLVAETFAVGYLPSALMFAVVIAVIAAARYAVRVNSVLAFWAAYILTRPLGASLGDYLSQSTDDGGLGLGTKVTTVAFLVVVLVLVTFLSLTRRDATESRLPAGPQGTGPTEPDPAPKESIASWDGTE